MDSIKKSIIIKSGEVEGVKNPVRVGSKDADASCVNGFRQRRQRALGYVAAQGIHGAHNHPEQAEFEYVASGRGTLESGQEKIQVEANMPRLQSPRPSA